MMSFQDAPDAWNYSRTHMRFYRDALPKLRQCIEVWTIAMCFHED